MIPLYHVDAFTPRPFAGNPAAVCLLDAPAPDAWMQALAAEMNLSETAFLVPEGAGFGLRWFTPAVEVDLCGHATLASAHVLWETGRLWRGEPAVFATRSGTLTCSRDGDWVAMDFPADPPAAVEPAQDLLAALGLEAGQVVFAGRTRADEFLVLDSAGAVRAVAPDFRALGPANRRGVIVTAAGEDGYDAVSRFFAPAAGIDEDPVTGSAHCAIAPWWSERLGRDEMRCWQASARGGEVRTRVMGDRVELRGQAVTVVRGEVASPGE